MMTWPEIRMAVGYAYLSQSLRVTSNNKPPSKENWPRKVQYDFEFNKFPIMNLLVG